MDRCVTKPRFSETRAIDFLKEQPEGQPFCLQVSFNATHAEDGDKRPGIGHYPWPKVTDGMYEGQRMPLPPLNDPSIYEAQPDFLKKSINRQRYFWRWDTAEKYQTNMRAYFRMISGIDHVVGRLVKQLESKDWLTIRSSYTPPTMAIISAIADSLASGPITKNLCASPSWCMIHAFQKPSRAAFCPR